MYFCEWCLSIIPFVINISTCNSLTENLQQKHFVDPNGSSFAVYIYWKTLNWYFDKKLRPR